MEDNPALKQLLEAQQRRMQVRRDMLRTRKEAEEAARADAASAGGTPTPWWDADLPPNMVHVRTPQELRDAVARGCGEGLLVVVNWFAPDCYACKSMQPKLRQMARERGATALFLKANAALDGLREHCEAAGVTKIPFFQLYRSSGGGAGGTAGSGGGTAGSGGGAPEVVAEFTANMQPEKLRLLRAALDEHGGGGEGAQQ